MKNQFITSRELVKGAARYQDLLYVISKGKSLLAEGISHTSLIAVDRGKWANCINTDWDSSAIAVSKFPSEKAVLVGEDGNVSCYDGGKSVTETIEPSPIMIRNARNIQGYVYVCGMKRQVYKRVQEENWIDISAPFPTIEITAGFEAIDGFSMNEIYTVGWSGEIWEFDGKNWVEHNSPTNLILTSVCCAPNNFVYIGGQKGTLIMGRKDSWEIIELDDQISIDIWDLCWFNDKLFIATITNLFTLNGNELVAVDFGEIGVPSCCSLTTSEGVLWSIGRDDVASFDGEKWRLYE